MKRLYAALLNTLRGFADALKNEAAVREEMAVLLLALPLGAWLAPSAAWYVAMIGALLLVLAVELLNTAMEKLADHVAPEWHPRVGLIKDYGSAAVFCTLLLAGLVWITALVIRAGYI